ncbi:nucleotide sugar dehydrogenase [Halobellus sp. Atlit-31R]|nr:nucleotide sugar dehydrogenase [Halobellus sp. Atlit-31R]
MTDFEHDLAVIGAGRIGLPWATVLASVGDFSVTCVDVDEKRVREINEKIAPFQEPGLAEHLQDAVDRGHLRATSDETVVADHEYVAFTTNAPRNQMDRFIGIIKEYVEFLSEEQVIINRTTLPVHMIDRMQELLTGKLNESPEFAVLPERLAEGKAIEEIKTLPKVVGVETSNGEVRIRKLLEPLGGRLQITDPRTAMFVKLIDNTYRDALFAIANQIAYSADVMNLDSQDAIQLANEDYPRNDIPSPGPVGGKCLPKDPHFLMDETICDQPTTPDLFNTTRRTNSRLPNYVSTEILKERPSKVAILGLSYKAGVGDTFDSPAHDIKTILVEQGVNVAAHDPRADEGVANLETAIEDADVVVLATNHPEYAGIEAIINDRANVDGIVYDLWGFLNREELALTYNGFGIAERRQY